jgi:hypothetical protein
MTTIRDNLKRFYFGSKISAMFGFSHTMEGKMNGSEGGLSQTQKLKE